MDWLISNNFAANRLEAVTLASVLLEENFLKPVGARSTEAVRSGDLAEQFLDDSTALYTFVSHGEGASCHQGRGKGAATAWGQGAHSPGAGTWFGGQRHPRWKGFLCEGFSFSPWQPPQPVTGTLRDRILVFFPRG